MNRAGDSLSLERLLIEIEAEVQQTASLTGRSKLRPIVLQALRETPRHAFVPVHQQDWAYANRPLPIGEGQTISQPFIVALMTDLLNPQPEHVVLEVGTGSGYQAAVLAHVVRKVYSLERIPSLAERAQQSLRALAIDNVEIRCADGYLGWQDHAPFDGIIVTAAAPHVPQALIRQLKPGGRMVIPVGLPYASQDLKLVTKDNNGRTSARSKLPVAFVPLVEGMD